MEDLNLTPGLGRSPGEGHGNPLQYSCLENEDDTTLMAEGEEELKSFLMKVNEEVKKLA